MRGQWFIDGTWQPLDEEESNLIEQEHLNCFRGQQMHNNFDLEIAKPVDHKDAVHSLKLSRSHVDWHSVDEVYLYSDATTSKIARTVTQKLGFSKASSSGTRLHRGYVEEATYEDKPVETTHIVFVVHGIGQKMDQGRIIKNTAMMRETARKMEEKHFCNLTTEHVEFLPVEWRSKLALDGDTVDSITPDKVRGIRDILNSSAMDIMYYTSPLYRDELVKGLQQELNRLYSLFCSRNPEFEEKGGKVSIVSHSLGCVITYDIMTGWNPVRLYEQLEQHEDEYTEDHWPSYEEQHVLRELLLTKQRLKELEDRLHGIKTALSNSPALKFKVENFFCMGSPLAVFLALRGIRPGNRGSQDHILPKAICNRLFNIFHPADPVAYRLEPLILKHYSNISPVQIHSSNTTNPTSYKHMKLCLINPSKETTSISDTESIPSPSTSPVLPRRHYGESITNIGKASILGAASIGKGIGGMLFSRFARSSATAAQGYEIKESAEGEDKKSAPIQGTPGSQTIPHSISGCLDSTLDLEDRIDFELREGLVESRYWSAMTSHTAYWSSMDVALFLLTFLYRESQEEDEESPDMEAPH
ncbi:phospholipase DDHD1 isoform X2 [Pelobates cultripes]|uniref:Phospholipase DDHD1 isoform X2 n=1 Tax=Pelobates cultripes TaxID=61616 RepID=A0AAD1WUF1_PELCU|nr:phospholipase DDHD1 isoform X2 [Pelobates cultripes]